jgi:hypothetical protein
MAELFFLYWIRHDVMISTFNFIPTLENRILVHFSTRYQISLYASVSMSLTVPMSRYMSTST